MNASGQEKQALDALSIAAREGEIPVQVGLNDWVMPSSVARIRVAKVRNQEMVLVDEIPVTPYSQGQDVQEQFAEVLDLVWPRPQAD